MFGNSKNTFDAALKGVCNLAYLIVGQTGLAALCWGIPGEAKSAYIQSLAAALGRKFYHFIPSLHLPDDLTGIPRLNKSDAFAKMVPMEFIAACKEFGWVFFFDEVNTSRSEMKPPLLSLLNEGRVGAIQWHPLTYRFAATNPDEWAPNAAPLEASLLNRMFHCDWEFPAESFHDGLENGLDFKVDNTFPVVDQEQTELLLPVVGKVVSRFLRSKPDLIRMKSAPEEGVRAYPSPRTWSNLTRSLAAAASVRAPHDTYGEIMRGWVGERGAAELCAYIAACDLYDIDGLVDGSDTPNYSADRVDQLIHLPWCMTDNLKTRKASGRLEEEHINNVVEIMVSLGENNLLDCCVGPMTQINKIDEDYIPRMPKSLRCRWDDLIEQIS